MKIYVTPFKGTECTGASVDSGFESLDGVVVVMGKPDIQGKRFLIYGDVIFSIIVFRIDAPVTMG